VSINPGWAAPTWIADIATKMQLHHPDCIQ
jgi:hypothetical protein